MGGADDRYNRSFSLLGTGTLQLLRHAVQFISFLFLNAKAFGFMSTVLVVPYLHASQSPWSAAIGAYDALELTLSHALFPILVLGIVYFTAITVGRVFCGWACPFGLVQDLLSYFPVRKQRLSKETLASLNDVKWAVVAFSALTTVLVGYRRSTNSFYDYPVGVFSDAPFSVISPANSLFTYIPWMLIWKPHALASVGLIGWIKVALLILVLAPSVYIPRFFCRFLCPMGALLEPLSKYKFLRIVRSPKSTKEELNKVLNDVCPMGVQITSDEGETIESSSCVHCGKCITEAPKLLEQRVL